MHSLLNPHPLLSSYLLSSFLLSSLFLLRQALRVARHMTELTRLPARSAILQMWESIKNACLAAEGKTAYAIQRDKERKRAKVQARKGKKNCTQANTLLGESEREQAMKNENEVASRAAVNASEKRHTGVPGPRLVAPPSS